MTHESIWAVVDDTEDGGLVAYMYPFPLGNAPLVTLFPHRVDEHKRLAQRIADESGRTIRLVRFTRAEVVATITPRPRG